DSLALGSCSFWSLDKKSLTLIQFVSLPEDAELQPVGTVSSIIQQLVVIQSLKDTPPLNDDSIIFRSDGLAVGKVFEVFGPVSNPLYILRFNSAEQISSKGLTEGLTVYYAPTIKEYTEYILTQQLKLLKGSDASWKNDQEPPAEALDYSDDEKEQEAKRKGKNSKKKRDSNNAGTHTQTGAPHVCLNEAKLGMCYKSKGESRIEYDIHPPICFLFFFLQKILPTLPRIPCSSSEMSGFSHQDTQGLRSGTRTRGINIYHSNTHTLHPDTYTHRPDTPTSFPCTSPPPCPYPPPPPHPFPPPNFPLYPPPPAFFNPSFSSPLWPPNSVPFSDLPPPPPPPHPPPQ
uniref:H/ACA ribonucleoprotein complex subunit n=1 Tax=Dicentrarchus labrax TaxID=13489 RepID=A0A8P4KLT6_DICLA